MGGCAILKQRDAVHIMIDGADLDDDGVIRRFVEKAFDWQSHHMIVAGVGAPADAVAYFGFEVICAFSTFDAVVADMAGAVARMVADHHRLSGGEIYIAGWSQSRAGAECYSLPGAQDRPFPAYKVLGVLGGNPPVSPKALRENGLFFQDLSADQIAEKLNPERDLLRVLELQRRQRHRVRSGAKRHIVGGYASLLSVTAEGVKQRIVHRWPDKIGETIDPKAA